MTKRVTKLARGLSAALLLLIICVMALDTYAAVADAQSEASCSPRASSENCYTIDTSRWEWMPRRVFLPLTVRSY